MFMKIVLIDKCVIYIYQGGYVTRNVEASISLAGVGRAR